MQGPQPYCFRPPDGYSQKPEQCRFSKHVLNLSDRQAQALAELVACLICGEESAIHVFHREGQRLSREAHVASKALLFKIAQEEAWHQLLLTDLALQLPTSNKVNDLRRSAQRFFIHLQSSDPALHFARIAALDASVARIMSLLIKTSRIIQRTPKILAICVKILNDEAHHVKISRSHALQLGTSQETLQKEAMLVKHSLINFLMPVSSAFDSLEVDPSILLKRITRDFSFGS